MLTQASIESLRTRYDASGLDGSETIYAARSESDTAFVAIAPDGKITTFKGEGYPDALLEEEIMALCCAKYDDRLTRIPREPNEGKYADEAKDSGYGVLIELLTAVTVLILGALFLFIYWLLFKDLERTFIAGAVICLPVVFFLFPMINAGKERGGQ